MGEPDLMTKEEIAVYLSGVGPVMSVRNVERQIAEAGIVPAVAATGRGHKAKFNRSDVEKMRQAREEAERRKAAGESQALTTTKPAVALVELREQQLVRDEAIAERSDPWPVWMTRADVLRLTGLPPSVFDAGVKGDKPVLPHRWEGRARRYHRDAVRRFAGSFNHAKPD